MAVPMSCNTNGRKHLPSTAQRNPSVPMVYMLPSFFPWDPCPQKTRTLPASSNTLKICELSFPALSTLQLPLQVYIHHQEREFPSQILGLETNTSLGERLPAAAFIHANFPSQTLHPLRNSEAICMSTLPATLLAVTSNIYILISNNHMFHLYCNFHLRRALRCELINPAPFASSRVISSWCFSAHWKISSTEGENFP